MDVARVDRCDNWPDGEPEVRSNQVCPANSDRESTHAQWGRNVNYLGIATHANGTEYSVPSGRYPPAIAPTTKKGSDPATTAAGSGASGDSWERSSLQAKNRRNARRFWVTWSRIVPRSIG